MLVSLYWSDGVHIIVGEHIYQLVAVVKSKIVAAAHGTPINAEVVQAVGQVNRHIVALKDLNRCGLQSWDFPCEKLQAAGSTWFMARLKQIVARMLRI